MSKWKKFLVGLGDKACQNRQVVQYVLRNLLFKVALKDCLDVVMNIMNNVLING